MEQEKTETIVKITFEDNKNPDKKAVMTIVDDRKITLEFIPAIGKDSLPRYAFYAEVFMLKLLGNKNHEK